MRYLDRILFETGEWGERKLVLSGNDTAAETIVMTFEKDSRMPSIVAIHAKTFSGHVRLHEWQFDTPAPPELFTPPADLPRKNVGQSEVYQMFDALRNIARMTGGK
jgi:hypothetical protein